MKQRRAVTHIFRDKRKSNHSIERLFAFLVPYFQKSYLCHRVAVPHQPSGLFPILRNIVYARRHAAGILHITGDAHYLAPFLRGRVVLTIHDCGYLQKLRGLKKLLYRFFWFDLPCRASARVTVISESTRAILEQEVGELGDKLRVIENCVTLSMKPKSGSFNAEKPKILQIGSGRHKNLDTLIRSVEGLSCEIVVVGKLSDENRHNLDRLGITYTNEYAISDERLEALYQECDILFFASRHEGFGLPILEAQSIGMPVITSNCYSMPHVVGRGGAVLDPEDASAIREAILTICADSDYRNEIIREGYQNVKRFDPAAIAEKYIKLYEELE